MKGLELSKSFYKEYGEKMLISDFSTLLPRLAIGLIGSGSECFSYDDNISMDHDFDPGFIIFIPDDIDENLEFKLKRAYAKLPMEYRGFKREIMSPVGGNRRGVKRVSDFLEEKTGTRDANLSYRDFLRIPEESLAELTNGEIWRDDSRFLTNIRINLFVMPKDVILKKLAGELLIMAQSGQYNFNRCIKHNEFGAARLAAYEFVNASIHAAFLLNEVYMPYYKWRFRALRSLSWPKDMKTFENMLVSLLSISDEDIHSKKAVSAIENISSIVLDRVRFDGLSKKDDLYLEPHAYEVNNRIVDNNLRNMHILSAI